MARDLDIRSISGVIFGLLLVVVMYVGIFFLATTNNPITESIDPQPNLSEEP